MIKEIALSAALLGGAYTAGVFDYRYARVVDRPPGQVAAALAKLDIRQAPGSPATDAELSGGVPPIFRHELSSSGVIHTVFSGKQVAVRMFADLEPIDGGRRTRVTTRVKRGDAPDDFVAPAFRSPAITAGLFDMVVDADLDKLTARNGDPEQCRKLMESLLLAVPDADMLRQDNLSDAFGDTARAAIRISAMQQEVRNAGCEVEKGKDFAPVSSEMTR